MSKITFEDKINIVPVTDRKKQVCAEDLNEIKEVVNGNATKLLGAFRMPELLIRENRKENSIEYKVVIPKVDEQSFLAMNPKVNLTRLVKKKKTTQTEDSTISTYYKSSVLTQGRFHNQEFFGTRDLFDGVRIQGTQSISIAPVNVSSCNEWNKLYDTFEVVSLFIFGAISNPENPNVLLQKELSFFSENKSILPECFVVYNNGKRSCKIRRIGVFSWRGGFALSLNLPDENNYNYRLQGANFPVTFCLENTDFSRNYLFVFIKT